MNGETKVLRLETLYRLQLLDEKQQQAYAALLWHYVSETTGLPEGKDLHLFAYENYRVWMQIFQ